MKWGQRKAEASGGGPQKLNRAEKKHAKKAFSTRGYIAVHNAAAKRMNDVEIPRINNKPQYKNADFTKDSPLRRRYYKEYETTLNKVTVEQYNKQFGTAPTGRRLKFSEKDGDLHFEWDETRHADGETGFLARRDARGHIVSIVADDESMEQADLDEDELEHYGVKGMKWGVRKTTVSDSSGGGRDVKVRAALGNRVVLTSGGNKRELSEDATKAAVYRQQAKRSNVRSLSNKELQDLVTRMNLERQYADLEKKRVKDGKERVENILAAGKQAVDIYRTLKK